MKTSTFKAAYLELPVIDLEQRVNAAMEALAECRLCPRDCGVDRLAGRIGSCRAGALATVVSTAAHFGEERPLVGSGGSGTIFFSGCALRCVFCQNHDISQRPTGRAVTTEILAGMMIDLQDSGCHNINLVTPTHFVPQILRALVIARGLGLTLPLVYNSSGFETVKTLRILDGIVDIYMPDFKYTCADVAGRWSRASSYPEAANAAILEMHRQVGDLAIDNRGLATRGLLVRHLVLPGDLAGTGEFLDWLAANVSKNTYLNLMDQYRPEHKAAGYPPLDRRLRMEEWRQAVARARAAGLARLDK